MMSGKIHNISKVNFLDNLLIYSGIDLVNTHISSLSFIPESLSSH